MAAKRYQLVNCYLYKANVWHSLVSDFCFIHSVICKVAFTSSNWTKFVTFASIFIFVEFFLSLIGCPIFFYFSDLMGKGGSINSTSGIYFKVLTEDCVCLRYLCYWKHDAFECHRVCFSFCLFALCNCTL